MSPFIEFVNTIIYKGLEAFGRYYSSYRAFVYDNKDPDHLQRLKVVIPQVSGDQAYNYWAYPMNVYFGKDHGSQMLPEIGDVIWVEFEGGHPERPIWKQGHPGIAEIPKDPDLLKYDSYWLLTPKGNLIKISDSTATIQINVKDQGYIEINKNGISLVTKDSISLGTLNKSEEPAVLGDSLEDLLNECLTDMGSIAGILTPLGPTFAINTSAQWKPFLEKWKGKWSKFKSKKVSLD